VLASGERACAFCDSPEAIPVGDSDWSTQGNLALNADKQAEWRGELNHRLQAYRARRRKLGSNESQTALPFEEYPPARSDAVMLEIEEQPASRTHAEEDFAFTIAIGRLAKKEGPGDSRLLIDVSVPPKTEEPLPKISQEPVKPFHESLFPVAPLYERRRAALIDAGCLAFAYGGFLALFGSLGGQFTFDKLSAAVCFFTFAFVYLQYFGLFTIFGGTTPGMMLCGLQVASFSGEAPTPRQFLLRAVGYVLSGGTLFLGFLWVLWDEDALTWHDRLSRTYLAPIETFVESDISQPTSAN
jgi:uncharacterized RDD family membrane protein YckC